MTWELDPSDRPVLRSNDDPLDRLVVRVVSCLPRVRASVTKLTLVGDRIASKSVGPCKTKRPTGDGLEVNVWYLTEPGYYVVRSFESGLTTREVALLPDGDCVDLGATNGPFGRDFGNNALRAMLWRVHGRDLHAEIQAKREMAQVISDQQMEQFALPEFSKSSGSVKQIAWAIKIRSAYLSRTTPSPVPREWVARRIRSAKTWIDNREPGDEWSLAVVAIKVDSWRWFRPMRDAGVSLSIEDCERIMVLPKVEQTAAIYKIARELGVAEETLDSLEESEHGPRPMVDFRVPGRAYGGRGFR